MKQDELNAILGKHTKWLRGEDGGNSADLCGADLHGADLRYANLRYADLSGADLCGANLIGANLSGANLSGANLSGADLCYADLCGANLIGANLSGANLSYADLCGADLRRADLCGADLCGAGLYGADLCGADLRRADLCGADLHGAGLYGADLCGAENLVSPIACPEKGSFIGWKKCRGNLIVELEICEDAKRSSATTRKCRCDKAKVIAITSPDGGAEEVAQSSYTPDFIYRVGDIVSVPDFDDNRWNECAPGIHFFISRQEAVDYT